MAKIIGVDFSAISKYRDKATVKMPNGDIIDLPLLKVRDASAAMLLLNRNDILASKYAVAVERLKLKAKSLDEVKATIAKNPESFEKDYESGFDAIDSAYKVIGDMQRKLNELQDESHALCDEIHAFIAPYLEGTKVIEQLKDVEDIYTIYVLQYMLNGAGADSSDEEETQENPTIPQSQSN